MSQPTITIRLDVAQRLADIVRLVRPIIAGAPDEAGGKVVALHNIDDALHAFETAKRRAAAAEAYQQVQKAR